MEFLHVDVFKYLNFGAKNRVDFDVDIWRENSNYFENNRSSLRWHCCKMRHFLLILNTVSR